jgi:hypothetical protein
MIILESSVSLFCINQYKALDVAFGFQQSWTRDAHDDLRGRNSDRILPCTKIMSALIMDDYTALRSGAWIVQHGRNPVSSNNPLRIDVFTPNVAAQVSQKLVSRWRFRLAVV